jgi:outer membrane protein assembly factor BamB
VVRFGVVALIVLLAPSCSTIDTHDGGAPPSQLFITDYADAIVRYDGVTGDFVDLFAGAAQQVDRPASVRLGPNGQLYSAGFGRGDISRYDITTGALIDVFYWDTDLLEEPVELRFLGDQLIVLGNDTANAVVIGPNGRAVRELGYPTMRWANDFVIGLDNNLYVATQSHPQLGTAVQVWDPATGTLLRHFGTPDQLAWATGIAVDAGGILYACDYQLERVVRFDPATGEWLGVLVDRGLRAPVSLDFGPDGKLYVLDADGLHGFDAITGEPTGTLVHVGEQLHRPAGFTFVTELEIARTRAGL